MFLNADEIWKIGETTRFSARYANKYYKMMGVEMIVQKRGSQREMKKEEKIHIYQYYLENGHLPPGNKIFR